jgi:hypothetical protein
VREGHSAAAVVGYDVDRPLTQLIEKLREHRRLRARTEVRSFGHFGVSQPEEVRSNAAPVRRQTAERAAPLITVEWIAVQAVRRIDRPPAGMSFAR